MSASSRRAADREREAARVLGVKRVRRSRYEKAPDVTLIVLPDGTRIQAECKTRKRLPRLLVQALQQAKDYGPPGCVPLAVVSELGGEALGVLPLRALARLLGREQPDDDTHQLALEAPTKESA